ncbi:MAG: TonB-dependent receptor [Gammaproteobacteria bacterium]|nr:TonB-dependent receptor [Gammaproteobacteria bacterium]
MKSKYVLGALTASLGTAAWGQALEEVVVTATRRALDLQEVPISIVAINGDNLEMRGMERLESLNATVPNLSVMGSSGGGGTTQTSFRVRGIPNVGVFIDGIWQVSTTGLLTQEFVDLERVEVLRGPQGTLYGRDSVGGAVRLVTKTPAEEFGATVKTTVGTYDRTDVNLSVDLPLADNLLTKWTAASLNRDGYIENLTVDAENGGVDQTVLRGDMLWTPTDSLSMRFNYMQNESYLIEPRIQDAIFLDAIFFPTNIIHLYNQAGADLTQEGQTAGYPGGEVGKWETKSQITLPNYVLNDQLAADVNWDITDAVSLQFLTGYIEQDVRNYVDFDNSQYAVVEDLNQSSLELFSQEIQASGTHGRFEWVAGLYYWDQESRNRSSRWSAQEFKRGELDLQTALNSAYCQQFPAATDPNFIPPAGNCEAAYNFYAGFDADALTLQQQDGWAIFGETNVSLTDALSLTVGVRHHDQENTSQALAIVPGISAPKPVTTNLAFASGDPLAGVPTGVITPMQFDKNTTRVSMQYQFTDSIMGYVSYSEGFNSGGVSISNIAGGVRLELPYDPETLKNREIGIRSDLADGRVRLNATYFDTIWDDIQASGVVRDPNTGIDLPGLVTRNVGEAGAKGLEVELTYLPTDNLQFNLNLGLLDTEYKDIALGTEGLVAGETEFSQAPETTYNVGVQYSANLASGGLLTTRVDYSYSDQYWRSPNPTLRTAWYPGVPEGFDETGDFGLVNARIAYAPADDNWEFAVFGTNLTNEWVLNSGFFHGIWGIDFATVSRPREAGATFTFRF